MHPLSQPHWRWTLRFVVWPTIPYVLAVAIFVHQAGARWDALNLSVLTLSAALICLSVVNNLQHHRPTIPGGLDEEDVKELEGRGLLWMFGAALYLAGFVLAAVDQANDRAHDTKSLKAFDVFTIVMAVLSCWCAHQVGKRYRLWENH